MMGDRAYRMRLLYGNILWQYVMGIHNVLYPHTTDIL